MYRRLICLLLLLALPALQAGEPVANVLADSDFTAAKAGDAPAAWHLTRGVLEVVDDATALVLDGSYATASQTVAIEPEWTHLELTATLRPRDVVRGDQDWKTARIALTFKDVAGKRVGPWPPVYESVGSADWQDFRRVYIVPAGAVSLDVTPANFGSSGRLELRRIALRPLTADTDASGPRPVIVLKLDDLTRITPRWQRVLDLLVAEEIPAGFGIIGSALERPDPELVAWIHAARDQHGIEFWNHGYRNRTKDDTHGEFEADSVAAQLASLQATQRLAQESLGFPFVAFGPHWSATNAQTIAALKQVPDLRIVFYYTDQSQDWFTYERFMDLEKPIFKPNAEHVISQFRAWAQRKPYLCLQGHPDSWDDDAFAQFVQVVRYLKEQGCQFMTPSGYVQAQHPEVLQVDGTQSRVTGLRADPNWFPFAIPGDDAAVNAVDFSDLSPTAAGADGFVRVQDGHFHTDAGRIRFWGMNTCFAANFPGHDEADAVAPHLRKLGLNAMRIHHMDGNDAPNGLLQTAADGSRSIDPEQLDRLDYFMARMNENGLYLNLNLHVNRAYTEYADFPQKDLPSEFRYTKFLLYFDPRLRAGFKSFCRDYLLHENPYRKLRRVDDPAIAMIEITNENSLAREDLTTVAKLPQVFRTEYDRQWNAWLATQYADTEALRRAWAPLPEDAPGRVVLDGAEFGREPGSWLLNVGEGEAHAVWDQDAAQAERRALKIDVISPARLRWKQELQRPGLSLVAGQPYTLSVRVRADKPCAVYLDVSNNGPTDWSSLGYGEELKLTTGWQTITRSFRANKTVDGSGRICLKMGGAMSPIYLADIHLREGADLRGLAAGQSVEEANIDFPITGYTLAATADARRFMAHLEQEFMEDMVRYLREDLGVRVPITGSQISYHADGVIAATADYVDMHAYWQHPQFPGRPWDMNNWLIQQIPVETVPGRDPVSQAARWRLHDRPFTLSEWNIADPAAAGASTVPLAAVIASLQDWDAVFFFDYNSKADGWLSQGPRGFFSFAGQPAKLALLGMGANLFRRGDLQALADPLAAPSPMAVPSTAVLSHRIGTGPASAALPAISQEPATRLATPRGDVVWTAESAESARMVIDTPATKGVSGMVGDSTVSFDGMSLEIGPVDGGYAAAFLSSRDGRPIAEARSLLFVAVGRAENPYMGWNADRSSVGRAWGHGPALVNGIACTLTLPGVTVKEAYALDGTGARLAPVAVDHRDGGARLQLGPSYHTLWYEIITE